MAEAWATPKHRWRTRLQRGAAGDPSPGAQRWRSRWRSSSRGCSAGRRRSSSPARAAARRTQRRSASISSSATSAYRCRRRRRASPASTARQMHLKDQLMLAISQSGRSDDLIAMTASAKQSGALTVAIINATDSPLAQACDFVLPICAGPELSVAATKTFIATAAALARLTAAWTKDAFARRRHRAACRSVWLPPPRSIGAPLCRCWLSAGSLVTIGRGSTLAIAREAALKLKETCNRHAEAFSGAEFLHGPVALVSSRYPDPHVHADRRRGARNAAAGWRAAPHGHGAVCCRARRRRRHAVADARLPTSPRPMPSA